MHANGHISRTHRASTAEDTRDPQARLARLRKARLVVLPVNDNPDSERSGGGHWSCLAFHRLAGGGALALTRVGGSLALTLVG